MSGDSSEVMPKKQRVPGWGVLGGAFGSAFVFFAPRFAIDPLAPGLLNMLALSRNNKVALYGIVVQLLTIGLIAAFVKLYRRPLSDIGLKMPKLGDLALAIPGFGVYYVLTVAVHTLVAAFYSFDVQEGQNLGFAKLDGPELILAFLSLVILVPIAEELLFRGILFTGIRRHFPFWVTALVVSLLFAVVHGQWNVGVDVFALSLVLCYLREETGSIWPSILLHSIKNGVAFTLRYIL